MPIDRFLSYYKVNGPRLHGFFSPLTMVAAMLALAAAALLIVARHPARWLTVAAALIALGIVGSFFIYFGRANASFASGALANEAVTPELSRWTTWHWWRTAWSFVALACAILALRE